MGLSNPRLPYNLEFVFVDKLGTGSYVLGRSLQLAQGGSAAFDMDSIHYHFDQMEYLAEAMRNPFEKLDELKGIVRTQVSYDRIPIKYDLFYLKGYGTRTYIPLTIEIPYSALTQKEIENEYYFSLTLLINVSNQLGQITFERSKDINFKHTLAEMDSLKDAAFQAQASLSLEPEPYNMHLLVLDNFSGKIGVLHQEFQVPEFSGEMLSLSDIILSSEEKTEEKDASLTEEKMLPKVSYTFKAGEEMNVHFEVYNLLLNPETGLNNFRAEYFFLHNEKLLAHV